MDRFDWTPDFPQWFFPPIPSLLQKRSIPDKTSGNIRKLLHSDTSEYCNLKKIVIIIFIKIEISLILLKYFGCHVSHESSPALDDSTREDIGSGSEILWKEVWLSNALLLCLKVSIVFEKLWSKTIELDSLQNQTLFGIQISHTLITGQAKINTNAFLWILTMFWQVLSKSICSHLLADLKTQDHRIWQSVQFYGRNLLHIRLGVGDAF